MTKYIDKRTGEEYEFTTKTKRPNPLVDIFFLMLSISWVLLAPFFVLPDLYKELTLFETAGFYGCILAIILLMWGVATDRITTHVI